MEGRQHQPARRSAVLTLLIVASGCGVTPKHFRKINDPAPIIRARSVGLGGGLPPSRVLPVLIARLDDKDPVVRLAAFEELRRTTGQSFGYVYWASEPERAQAVARWREWWNSQPHGPTRPR